MCCTRLFTRAPALECELLALPLGLVRELVARDSTVTGEGPEPGEEAVPDADERPLATASAEFEFDEGDGEEGSTATGTKSCLFAAAAALALALLAAPAADAERMCALSDEIEAGAC